MTEAGGTVTRPLPVVHHDRPDEFRLGDGEPLALGVQRIVIDQIDRCIDLIRHQPDPDRTVHEMRKALKRVRAMLRLVRGEVGRFRYREENVVLRDTARRWSAVRDGAVLVTVAEELAVETEAVGEFVGRRLIGLLEERAADTRRALTADRRLHIDTLTTLLCFRARVARFPVVGDGAFPDRFDSIRPGLLRTARRTRAEMETARSLPTAHHLHQWRKRVKYLRHQVEVLEPAWEDLLGALARRLDSLGSLLGDDHDRAELGRVLATDHTLIPDERSRHRVLVAVERARIDLQAEAFALGGSVLGPSPDAIVDQIGAAWGYWRS